MDGDLVHVNVEGIAMASQEADPTVILAADGGGTISLPIGLFEASAIIMRLEGLSPPRPLTHDLLAALFREEGFTLHRVVLYGAYSLSEDSCLARLEYGKGWSKREKDVRPSDAIALALRLGAPIFASRRLISGSERTEKPQFVHSPQADDCWYLENRAIVR